METNKKKGEKDPSLLVLCPRTDMGLWLAPVESGVSHAPDVGVHVNLGPHTVLLTHCTSLLHLLPHRQVLLHTYNNQQASYTSHFSSSAFDIHIS